MHDNDTKFMDYLLREFADYYNMPHTSMVRDLLPPVRNGEPDEIETLPSEQIETRTYVGGLVTAFVRKAAKRPAAAQCGIICRHCAAHPGKVETLQRTGPRPKPRSVGW